MDVVILGGGFGGIVAAHTLRGLLGDTHNVTLISAERDFYLRAAFPRLAFEGDVQPDDLRLRLDEVLPAHGIQWQHARVTAIQPETHSIETTVGQHSYDYLVIALGTYYAEERVAGLREFSASLWTIEAAQRLQQRLQTFAGGSFVTGTAPGSPCEGPTWEAAFHMHHLMMERGLRDRTEIHLFTTKPHMLQPTGPMGQSWAEQAYAEVGVHLHTRAELAEVTAERIIFRDGRELPVDLALVMAPYEGHDVIKQAGLGDPHGFILVDDAMRTRSHHNIFAIGDAVALPERPKMAHNAMRGAQVAAATIAHEIGGQPASEALHYELVCVIGNGGGRGTYLRSDVPWGGTVSVVQGGYTHAPGLSADEAGFLKTAFGEHFLSRGGDIRYVL